nr:MAG TPA: hypothetical protein [Bacteriophage sp.]
MTAPAARVQGCFLLSRRAEKSFGRIGARESLRRGDNPSGASRQLPFVSGAKGAGDSGARHTI